MKVIVKSFYSHSKKKTFYKDEDIKEPLQEWIKEGLVEAPKEEKEEKKEGQTKELKRTRRTKAKK